MEHIQNASTIHLALTKIHPAFANCVFILAIITGFVGYMTLSNVSFIVSISGGALYMGYQAWRWRHNYKVAKKYPNKPIK